MSGGILSRFRRKPASVSELLARSRVNAGRAPNQAAQASSPDSQPLVSDALATRAAWRPGPMMLSAAVLLVFALAGAWGVSRLSLSPPEVQASSRPPPASLSPPANGAVLRADPDHGAPARTPSAPRQDASSASEVAPSAIGAALAASPIAPIQTSIAAPPTLEPLAGGPVLLARGSIVDIVSQGEPLRLRVLARAEARSLSNGRWGQGLQVVEASAGNRLDVRTGDVIYDLCDRVGDQSAAEIMTALAAPVPPTCVSFVRGAGQRTN